MRGNGLSANRKEYLAQRIDILWLVEHVAREMDTACAVAAMLRAKGRDVRVRHMYYHADDALARFDPAVVVHPFFYFARGALGTEQYVERWPDAAHCNMNWEQLHYHAHEQAKAPADDWARTRVIHHAWGDFARDYLVRHGVDEQNVFVAGNPSLQLALPPYAAFFPDRHELARRHGLDPGLPWAFFPENYRWAFMTDAKLDFHASLGADRAELGRMRDYCLRAMERVLGWCDTLARQGAQVIFRPRPATPAKVIGDFVRQALGTPSANLRILKQGSVREWILASDVVLSSISTSLIEAAVAGRPAFMAEPEPVPDGLLCQWYAHAPKLADEAAFVRAGLRPQEAGKADDLADWARRTMLGRGDPLPLLADRLDRMARDAAGERALGPLGRPVRCNAETHEADRFDDADALERIRAWEAHLG